MTLLRRAYLCCVLCEGVPAANVIAYESMQGFPTYVFCVLLCVMRFCHVLRLGDHCVLFLRCAYLCCVLCAGVPAANVIVYETLQGFPTYVFCVLLCVMRFCHVLRLGNYCVLFLLCFSIVSHAGD